MNNKYDYKTIMEWKKLMDKGVSAQKIKEMYKLDIPRQNIYTIVKYRTDPTFKEKMNETSKQYYRKNGGMMLKASAKEKIVSVINGILEDMEYNETYTNKVTNAINYEFLFGKLYACFDILESLFDLDTVIEIEEQIHELRKLYEEKMHVSVERLYKEV